MTSQCKSELDRRKKTPHNAHYHSTCALIIRGHTCTAKIGFRAQEKVPSSNSTVTTVHRRPDPQSSSFAAYLQAKWHEMVHCFHWSFGPAFSLVVWITGPHSGLEVLWCWFRRNVPWTESKSSHKLHDCTDWTARHCLRVSVRQRWDQSSNDDSPACYINIELVCRYSSKNVHPGTCKA